MPTTVLEDRDNPLRGGAPRRLWFAVDASGHLACLDAGRHGVVPIGARHEAEPLAGVLAWHLSGGDARGGLADGLALAEAPDASVRAGALAALLERSGFTDAFEALRHSREVFLYAEPLEPGEAYERAQRPAAPVRVGDLPENLRISITSQAAPLPVRFADEGALQPADHVSCEGLFDTYVASDGTRQALESSGTHPEDAPEPLEEAPAFSCTDADALGNERRRIAREAVLDAAEREPPPAEAAPVASPEAGALLRLREALVAPARPSTDLSWFLAVDRDGFVATFAPLERGAVPAAVARAPDPFVALLKDSQAGTLDAWNAGRKAGERGWRNRRLLKPLLRRGFRASLEAWRQARAATGGGLHAGPTCDTDLLVFANALPPTPHDDALAVPSDGPPAWYLAWRSRRLARELHEHGQCLGCFALQLEPESSDTGPEDRVRFSLFDAGFFRYAAHQRSDGLAGAYERSALPWAPTRVKHLPTPLRLVVEALAVPLPVRFIESPALQPAEHTPCWSTEARAAAPLDPARPPIGLGPLPERSLPTQDVTRDVIERSRKDEEAAAERARLEKAAARQRWMMEEERRDALQRRAAEAAARRNVLLLALSVLLLLGLGRFCAAAARSPRRVSALERRGIVTVAQRSPAVRPKETGPAAEGGGRSPCPSASTRNPTPIARDARMCITIPAATPARQASPNSTGNVPSRAQPTRLRGSPGRRRVHSGGLPWVWGAVSLFGSSTRSALRRPRACSEAFPAAKAIRQTRLCQTGMGPSRWSTDRRSPEPKAASCSGSG